MVNWSGPWRPRSRKSWANRAVSPVEDKPPEKPAPESSGLKPNWWYGSPEQKLATGVDIANAGIPAADVAQSGDIDITIAELEKGIAGALAINDTQAVENYQKALAFWQNARQQASATTAPPTEPAPAPAAASAPQYTVTYADGSIETFDNGGDADEAALLGGGTITGPEEAPAGYLFDYQTGQFVPATEADVLAREEFYQQYPQIGPPGTPGTITPQEYTAEQLKLDSLIQTLFPGQNVQTLLAAIDQDPKMLREEILKVGLSEQTEALLEALFPGITPEEITQIFFGAPYDPQQQSVQKVLRDVFADIPAADFAGWAKDNQQAIIERLQDAGRSHDAEEFLKALIPGITEQQIKAIFDYDGPDQQALNSTIDYLDEQFDVQNTRAGNLDIRDSDAVTRAMIQLGMRFRTGSAAADWRTMDVEDKRRIAQIYLQDPNRSQGFASFAANLSSLGSTNWAAGLLTGQVSWILDPLARQMTGQPVSALDWTVAGTQLALFFTGPIGRGIGGVLGKAAGVGIIGGAGAALTADTIVHWDEMGTTGKVVSVGIDTIIGLALAGALKARVPPQRIRQARQAVTSKAGEGLGVALDDLENGLKTGDPYLISKAGREMQDIAATVPDPEVRAVLSQKGEAFIRNADELAATVDNAPDPRITQGLTEAVAQNSDVLAQADIAPDVTIKNLDPQVQQIAPTVKPPVAEPVGAGTQLGRRIQPKIGAATAEGAIGTVAKTAPKEIVKRSDIIKDLSEKLNVPIRRGHFRGPAVGIYKQGREIIRIKQGGLDTITHEVGHLLDERFDLVRRMPDAELPGLLSEYGQPVAEIKYAHKEALAEFLRYYISEPATALSKAPTFSTRFEAFLQANPDVAAVIQAARADYARYLQMPATARVASQISLEPTPVASTWAERFNKLYKAAFDELYPVRQFVKTAQKRGIKVLAEEDPYTLARLTRGNTGKSATFLEEGTFGRQFWKMENGKPVPDYKGPGLKQILQPVEESIDDFRIYLVSRRAVTLAGRKIETGIALADAKASIAELEARHAQFPETAQKLYRYQTQVLEYARDAGLISDDMLAKLAATSENYVPFYRVLEELQAQGFMGKGMANVRSPIKKIKGSERDIIDPLESIVKNTYAIVDAANRNAVGVAMSRLAGKDMVLGQMMEEIPVPMVKVATVTAKDLGPIPGLTEEMADQAVNIFRPAMNSGKESILSVMVEGQRKFYQLEPNLYKAVMAMEREEVGWIIKLLSYPTRVLRAGAILNPEFILGKNPFRDTISAWIYSRYGFVPFYDTIKGVVSVVRKDKDYQLWRMAGGERSMMVSMDRQYLQKTFTQVLKGKGAIEYVKHPIDALQAIGEFTEAGSRLGEFKRGLGKKATPIESGFASREVTLDYSVHGAQTKSLNMIAAFFNANMRGIDKFVREAIQHPQTFYPKVFLGITVPSLTLYLINRQDPRWKEIPQWQKDLFWIFFVGDKIIRLPKPFEPGIIFGSVFERTLEALETDDPEMFKELGSSVWQMLPGLMPTGVEPILENMTNFSFFTQRQVVPDSLKDLPDARQFTDYTSATAKTAGKLFGYSPMKIDNLIQGYTAGLGKYAVAGLDGILRGTGIAPDLTKPSAEWADIPMVRAFVIRDPYGTSSVSVSKMYDAMERFNLDEKELKALLAEGDEAGFGKYRDEHPDSLFVYDFEKATVYSVAARFMRTAAGAVSELRNKQREIYRSDLSAEEKRDLIDQIDVLITNTARAALDNLQGLPQTPYEGTVPADAADRLLYDYSAVLPTFLRDWVWENRNQMDDNRLLTGKEQAGTWEEADAPLIDQYRESVKDQPGAVGLGLREDNPELDAALNFWGQASTVQTPEAYRLLEERARALGIPNSVFPALKPGLERILTIEYAYRDAIIKRAAYADARSPEYIKDEDARRIAYKLLDLKNRGFADARSRLTMLKLAADEDVISAVGAPSDEVIEQYVNHQQIVRQYGANSPEAKLDLMDHRDLLTWGQSDETFGWGEVPEDSEPVLRLQVKNRELSDAYDTLKNKVVTDITPEDLLHLPAVWRTLASLQAGLQDLTVTPEALGAAQVDLAGALMKQYSIPSMLASLVSNLELKVLTRATMERYGVDAIGLYTGAIWITPQVLAAFNEAKDSASISYAVEVMAHETGHALWEQLTPEQRDQFWALLSDPRNSALLNAVDTTREGADRPNEAYASVLAQAPRLAAQGINLPPELNTFYQGIDVVALGNSKVAMQGYAAVDPVSKYLKDHPELSETVSMGDLFKRAYPEWADDMRRIEALRKGLAEDMVETYVDYYRQPLSGYEDDWFLMEHEDFYKAMVDNGTWQERDFSKVPTREVGGLYQQYLDLQEGDPRTQFRLDNPKLDKWLVEAKGYKPAEPIKAPPPDTAGLYEQYLKLPIGKARMDFRKANPALDDWLVNTKGYKPAK